MLYEGLVLFSEVVLSAYPMLIKLVDVSVFFQTGLRMGIYALLAVTAARASGQPLALDRLLSAESLYTGVLNLVHVLSSYTAFSALPAGNAMALFYTYPIWNIVGTAAAFGERVAWSALPWLAVALVGAILLAQPTAGQWALYGVLAALVAALTETGIYLWFRSRAATADAGANDAPWAGMAQMYGSSGVLWAVAAAVLGGLGALAANTWRISARSAATIAAFNTFVGFAGYALRFYIIPKVSTVAFSAMSFFGVVAAYGLDWLFTGTLPTPTQALGAAAIVAANTVLLRKETV
jgi:drug/metabolite transporter (DMT)-like permease